MAAGLGPKLPPLAAGLGPGAEVGEATPPELKILAAAKLGPGAEVGEASPPELKPLAAGLGPGAVREAASSTLKILAASGLGPGAAAAGGPGEDTGDASSTTAAVGRGGGTGLDVSAAAPFCEEAAVTAASERDASNASFAGDWSQKGFEKSGTV